MFDATQLVCLFYFKTEFSGVNSKEGADGFINVGTCQERLCLFVGARARKGLCLFVGARAKGKGVCHFMYI